MTDIRLLNAILSSNFTAFGQKVFETLSPSTRFHMNWHIDAIAYHLEMVRRGEIKRLIINVPPRSLKSVMGSVAFPAFILGNDPSQRVICASYSSSLASEFANRFRVVVNAPWYRRTFPGMKLSRLKNTEFQTTTTEHGFRFATSTEGTLTGRGGNIIVLDDPLKADDALSTAKRTAVNNWFGNTLQSRLDDKRNGAIVIISQRLHEDDLVGHVTRFSNDWVVLNLPAIAEVEQMVPIGPNTFHRRRVGDVLNPSLEPASVLAQLKLSLGSDVFSAQFQQAPVPPGGSIIKREWIKRYDDLPASKSPMIFQSWDTASKEGGTNDWSVCTTWMAVGKHFYLMDVTRQRVTYPDLKRLALDLYARFKPYRILIEDTGVGTGLVPDLREAGVPAVAVKPEGDKLTRMTLQSIKFESGFVHIPRQATWLADFEAELFAFPGGRHDDQVDSISQALGNHTAPADYRALADGYRRLIAESGNPFARLRYIG